MLCEKEKFYLYGTRADNFGAHTAGFERPTFTELENLGDLIKLKK